MKLRNLWILVVLLQCALLSNGQDIHFSQYFASPLTLNPALTGSFNADFRVAANYRNQFFKEFGNMHGTYATYSGSFDMALFRKKLDPDQFGVGLVFYQDQAGTGSLATTSLQASVAYHKVLDKYERHSLSLGVQAGFIQKKIDFNKLTFETQFDQFIEDFNPTLANQETNAKSSIIYPDFNIGILWRSRLGKIVTLYAGFAFENSIRPKESFLGDTKNRLDSRFVAHGGIDIKVGKYITLTPGFMLQYQSSAHEATAGMALGYKIDDYNALYVGAWYRIGDAVIPMVAYEIHDFRLGVSFDATMSDLKVANSSKGAVELSLIYIYNNKPPRDISPVKFCPRF